MCVCGEGEYKKWSARESGVLEPEDIIVNILLRLTSYTTEVSIRNCPSITSAISTSDRYSSWSVFGWSTGHYFLHS